VSGRGWLVESVAVVELSAWDLAATEYNAEQLLIDICHVIIQVGQARQAEVKQEATETKSTKHFAEPRSAQKEDHVSQTWSGRG
jgi:DNA-binding protein H-NS